MTTPVQTVNFRWPQGEDLHIQLVYKEGDTPSSAVPVPLNAGYDLRMDIVVPTTKEVVYSLTASEGEVTLSSGSGGNPNIDIVVPRAATLPGGVIYDRMSAGSGNQSYAYDVFLRNTQTNRQVKVLRGNITVEASHTLWQ